VTTNSSYTSSGDDDDAEDDGSVGDFAMGALWLNVFQGSYSLNNVDDVQPKVLGTLLGSIGGFWGKCTSHGIKKSLIEALRRLLFFHSCTNPHRLLN